VSVTGVTGERSEVSARVQALIPQVKAKTDKTVCVGFGVSTKEQAKQLQDWGADGVIVGSALVKKLAGGKDASEGVADMKALLTGMREALDGN
jgi:tryptophan synthase alpha chain